MSEETIQQNPSVPAAEPVSNTPSEPGEKFNPIPYSRFKEVLDERNRLRAEQESWKQAEKAGSGALEQQFAQLRQELDAMKQQAEAARREAIRAQVGAEFKLPAALAGRLQGDNEEALRADAQALMAAIQAAADVQPAAPKATPTPAPLPTSTGNPGGGMRVTRDQLAQMSAEDVARMSLDDIQAILKG